MVDSAVLGQIFLRLPQFSAVIIPPMLKTHPFIYYQYYIISVVNSVVK